MKKLLFLILLILIICPSLVFAAINQCTAGGVTYRSCHWGLFGLVCWKDYVRRGSCTLTILPESNRWEVECDRYIISAGDYKCKDHTDSGSIDDINGENILCTDSLGGQIKLVKTTDKLKLSLKIIKYNRCNPDDPDKCLSWSVTYESKSCLTDLPCTNGDKRCIGDILEVCTTGAWTIDTDCAVAGETCDSEATPPACTTPECTEGDKRCTGDILEVCTAGTWEEDTNCAAEGKVCDSTSLTCVEEVECIDTDVTDEYTNGRNYYVKGQVEMSGIITLIDACAWGRILQERICRSNTPSSEIYQCPNGCNENLDICICDETNDIPEDDCPTNYECIDGACVVEPECTTDEDCAADEECTEGVCEKVILVCSDFDGDQTACEAAGCEYDDVTDICSEPSCSIITSCIDYLSLTDCNTDYCKDDPGFSRTDDLDPALPCYYSELSGCELCGENEIDDCFLYDNYETCELDNPCESLGIGPCEWVDYGDDTGECIDDDSFDAGWMDNGNYIACEWRLEGSWEKCNPETGTMKIEGEYTLESGPPECWDNAPPATEKSCLVTKQFPFFSSTGIILALILLIGYYALVNKKRQ